MAYWLLLKPVDVTWIYTLTPTIQSFAMLIPSIIFLMLDRLAECCPVGYLLCITRAPY